MTNASVVTTIADLSLVSRPGFQREGKSEGKKKEKGKEKDVSISYL